VAVAIIAVSLLFSNHDSRAPKSKLYTGQQQQQQSASQSEVAAFEAATAAEAERARKQAEALRETTARMAAIQNAQASGMSTDPAAGQPCQMTPQGCFGYQPRPQASPVDAALAEKKARRERQMRASSLALDLSQESSGAQSVAVAEGPVEARSEVRPESALATPAVEKKKPLADFDRWSGKLYRVFEGTFLEVVVKNRINGDAAGPIEAMLTNDVYSLNSQHLLLPKGTVLIGEAHVVTGQFDERLFVAFHRLICPDGFSVNLDQFHGLTQQGEVGLKDKVNHHYISIFGAAIAVAAIGGISNIGNATTGVTYNPTVQFRAGVATQMGEASQRILDRYLNRLPTLVIREGARSRIFVSQDFEVPGYAGHRMDPDL
jgi:type IV secretion system protein TrbI